MTSNIREAICRQTEPLTSDNGIRRYAFCDDRLPSNDRPVPDLDAGIDDGVVGYPDVISDPGSSIERG